MGVATRWSHGHRDVRAEQRLDGRDDRLRGRSPTGTIAYEDGRFTLEGHGPIAAAAVLLYYSQAPVVGTCRPAGVGAAGDDERRAHRTRRPTADRRATRARLRGASRLLLVC
jgi:hypothetical protein